jgi:hypothetical protein
MPITRRTMLRTTTALLGSLAVGAAAILRARAQGKEVRIIATGEAYGAAMKVVAEAFH